MNGCRNRDAKRNMRRSKRGRGVSRDFLKEGRIGMAIGISREREGCAYRGAYKDGYKDLLLLIRMLMWMPMGMSYCL